jgi:NAD(P)-dependent dehydrogenase (short-subunit alcohol dehydrogenase family)
MTTLSRGSMSAPTMDGKVVLITGANSGVGLAAARALAAQGAEILLVCRSAGRGATAREDIARLATGRAPSLCVADLSSQAAIRALSRETHARTSRIDVLINNAGGIFARRELSVDRVEKTWATNHLAPFLLTNLLLDLVRAAPAGRIVTVASESHSGALDFDNLQGERQFNFFAAYNRSKLANILFTYELARRLGPVGITANCVSPGPTVTRFGNEMTGLPGLFPRLMKRIPFLFGSPEQGARTLVFAASARELANTTGRFLLKSRQHKTRTITYDAAVAARLWTVSEELTGQSFL